MVRGKTNGVIRDGAGSECHRTRGDKREKENDGGDRARHENTRELNEGSESGSDIGIPCLKRSCRAR